MKLLFLDIDGVLNDEADFFEAEFYGHEHNKPPFVISRTKLALLERILTETGARLVITSPWREEISNSDIHEMFRVRGFRLSRNCIVGKTIKLGNKEDEIEEYLKGRDDVESYLILDTRSETRFHRHGSNLMEIDPFSGLTYAQSTRAIAKLGRIGIDAHKSKNNGRVAESGLSRLP